MTYHPKLAANPKLADVLRWVTHGYWIDDQHIMYGPNVSYVPVQPEASTQPIIHPYQGILHSNAGLRKTAWWNLIAYWRRTDIVGEAHFQVDGVDGNAFLIQAMPLNRRADCNYKANRFIIGTTPVGAISFETQDRGGATLASTPWSLGSHDTLTESWGQLDTMISALTAISVCYGVWCTAPVTWNDSGIGHHSLFPEWSSYVGKTCPGAARIRQMDYIRKAVADNLVAISRDTGWKCGTGKPS